MDRTEHKVVYFAEAFGQQIPFVLYPLDSDLPDTAGIYIYTHAECGDYTALYIGQTENLQARCCDKNIWRCVNIHNANAICVHFENDATMRQRLLLDLIEKHKPVCHK